MFQAVANMNFALLYDSDALVYHQLIFEGIVPCSNRHLKLHIATH